MTTAGWRFTRGRGKAVALFTKSFLPFWSWTQNSKIHLARKSCLFLSLLYVYIHNYTKGCCNLIEETQAQKLVLPRRIFHLRAKWRLYGVDFAAQEETSVSQPYSHSLHFLLHQATSRLKTTCKPKCLCSAMPHTLASGYMINTDAITIPTSWLIINLHSVWKCYT